MPLLPTVRLQLSIPATTSSALPDPSTPPSDRAPPLGEVAAEAGPLPTNTRPPTGVDTRGMGLETFDGRGGVRTRKGSSRPPTISPEIWQMHSAKRKKEAIAEYLAEIAIASASDAAVATAVPGVASAEAGPAREDIPRLPRQFKTTLVEPHRDKTAWHPPCCIARKLSKGEMTSCPRARKALDAEWEKLRFLKRPHPTKGVGAWDEGVFAKQSL